ncbi:sodium-dependent transporter [Pseudohongiella nitratireducens]|uniref:Sodium-dependent transporter n=1 Tax=Pseudohongiella nitratireducens TaxID=1768907 RepID=A0A916QMK7_9GAMM|nr:sodium-dependent transporter [Pseudohongiella nitratireducens]GFZ81304.1 sodium-dependent transporter [Pseudohongiella nitratireducens]
MSAPRGEFSSRFGFLMAASGSAVGLGNIWGFPTNTASNGGAAFLFTYIVLAFAIAYPALMAELIIGRHAKANAVTALRGLARGPLTRALGGMVGYAGMITVSLILSFYAIVSGWMLAMTMASLANLLQFDAAADWLATGSVVRDAIFTLGFMLMTLWVVTAGVSNGIEKWASRLMPSLFIILVCLIIYVFTLDGAMEGLRMYLVPDFSRMLEPGLVVSAMGQAFFSLSLGVGTMLIYGSYINRRENLPALGRMVTLLDISVAVTAGLLILPAMTVALNLGVPIYDEQGGLIAGPGLIISVLPALFDQIGLAGILVSLAFFILMTIASLTSSISMLEVPLAYVVENYNTSRRRVGTWLTLGITAISLLIVFNFDTLFDLVVSLTTEYSQPLLGFFFAIFAGWIWHRNGILQEIRQGSENVEHTMFWRIWPVYVKFVVPVAILAIYLQTLLG